MENLVNKGHLAEYVKGADKGKNDDIDSDEEPTKMPMNRVVTSVVEAIHASTNLDALTKNSL